MNTPRRNNRTGNSRDRFSYECRCWIGVRMELPLATKTVSTCPSKLVNVSYCLIRLDLVGYIDSE